VPGPTLALHTTLWHHSPAPPGKRPHNCGSYPRPEPPRTRIYSAGLPRDCPPHAHPWPVHYKYKPPGRPCTPNATAPLPQATLEHLAAARSHRGIPTPPHRIPTHPDPCRTLLATPHTHQRDPLAPRRRGRLAALLPALRRDPLSSPSPAPPPTHSARPPSPNTSANFPHYSPILSILSPASRPCSRYRSPSRIPIGIPFRCHARPPTDTGDAPGQAAQGSPLRTPPHPNT